MSDVLDVRLLSLVACLGLAACQPNAAARFPSATTHPDEERRPDGIAVDLASDPPPTQDAAESGQSIVTLRTPLGMKAAHDTVRQFFSAMVAEDIQAMSQLVEPNAVVQDTDVKPASMNAQQSHGIAPLWTQRFRKREYQRLEAAVLYRDKDVMTYRGSDLDALPLSVRYLPATEPSEATDLVLRVPIATPTIRNERLLGDELYFWLRRDGERFVIYRMAEAIPF